jgi:hypothetical protein
LLEQRTLLASNPIITEFLADNATGLRDSNGTYADWLEIYNPDSRDAIDLTGWRLRYKTNNYWSFPSMTLGPGEYRVVFCTGTGTGRTDPNGELHADFNLDKSGARIRLLNPTNEVIQDIDYGNQQEDVSYGVGQEVTETKLLSAGATTRYYVPSSDVLGQAWTAPNYLDTGWSQGNTGLGVPNVVPGFAVWGYKASSVSTIGSLAMAQSVVDIPSYQSWVQTDNPATLNYWNYGGRGRYLYDTAFPGLEMNRSQVNYVVKATATMHVPTAGYWTFGINSDDGFRLTIPGATFLNVYGTAGTTIYNGSSMQFDGTRTAAESLGVVNFASPGDYAVDLLYYQGASSAELEFFAAQGNFNGWGGTLAWRLVGDTAAGGLAVDCVPFSGPESTIAGRIQTNVSAALAAASQHTSLYTRTTFDASNWSALDSLTLKMAYDDGYVAWLNGVEIARRNAPTSVTWDAQATAVRPSEVQSSTLSTIDISSFLDPENPHHLQTTGNVLAVQVLNASPTDADLLLLPEIAEIASTQGSYHFFAQPTPAAVNSRDTWQKADDPEFSQDHGFYDDPFLLELSSDTVGASIYYTTDSSAPWNANVFTALTNPTSRTVAITRVDSTATVTASAHGLVNGQMVTISGANQPEYNGTFLIFNVQANTFDFTVPGAPYSPATGTVYLQAYPAQRSGSTATLTLKNHGYANGDLIRVEGAALPEYNGVFPIFGVTSDTFSYTLGAAGPAGGGAINILKVDRAVQALAYAGTTATATATGHGFATGDLVRILGALQPEYNGDFLVTVLDANSFTYTLPATPTSAATGSLAAFKLGTRYTAPIPITTTTAVRARAYLGTYEPSDVVTQTYIYLDDVINQPANPPGFPANWDVWPADYQMDPRITQDPAYKDVMRDALMSIPTISIVSDVSNLFDANTGVIANAASLAGGSYASMRAASSIEYFDPNGDEDGFQINAGVQISGGASRGAQLKKHGMRIVFRDEFGPGKLEYPLFGEDAADEFNSLTLRCSFGDQWTIGGSNVQFIKNAYAGALQLSLGQPGLHAMCVNVYIDGLFWGLYDFTERPDGDFASSYMGGDEEDWEANNAGLENDTTLTLPYWNSLLNNTKVGFAATGYQAGTRGFNTTFYAAGASSTPGMTTITYRANTAVTTLAEAESVIATPTKQISQTTGTATTINYINTGDGRFTTGNNYFPGIGSTQTNNFVVETTAAITIPTGGYWSFGATSNDGFKLTLTNGTDTFTFNNDGTRTGYADRFGAFNIITPGQYRMRVVYFQNTGEAELEVFAAQGYYTSWTATTSWRLVGDTANGGLATYQVESLTNLAQAESLMSTPSKQGWVRTQTPATINYLNLGADGHYASTTPFPSVASSTQMPSFAVKVESTIAIPSTGYWTFGVSCDDGFHLTLMDGLTTILDSYYDGVRSTPTDTLKSVNITKAGSYSLRLVYFQSTNVGAELELYAAKGNYSSWGAATTWQPIGNNVPYTSYSMNNAGLLTLAAVKNINNLTDAESVVSPTSKAVSSLWPKTAVTNITRSGSTATVSLPGHGFVTGQMVLVSGAEQASYNGTFQITVIDADNFSYIVSGTPASPASGLLALQPYGISRRADTAIVWLPSHGLAVGDYVTLSGTNQGEYNQTFPILSVTANTFSFQVYNAPASPGTGTTITATKALQAWTFPQTINTINYCSTGGTGHYANTNTSHYPGGVTGLLLENYVFEAKTSIYIPSAGPWTFGVNSDEGFRLELIGDTETFTAECNTLRTPNDTLTTFNIANPGMYRLRLVQFQKSAGAAVELFAAKAAPDDLDGWQSWSETSTWRLVGDVGGLGTSLSNVATVTTYQANLPVTSIDEAQSVVNDPLKQVSVSTEYRNLVNMLNSDDEGRFSGSASFPGITTAGAEDFVVQIDATLVIPTAGAWWFAVSCDDGFRLTFLDNNTPLAVIERTGTGDFTDTVDTVNFPRTGTFTYQLLYYQHTGDAGLELSAARASEQPSPKALSGIGIKASLPGRSATGITRTGTLATVAMSGHGFAVGQTIVVSGVDQAEYNGTFTVTAAMPEGFSYVVADTAVSPATGTITAARVATSVTRNSTTVTVTMPSHGFANGGRVLISGATPADYNGVYTITGVAADTFTYTLSGSTAASPAGGTILASMAGIMRSGTTATVTLANHGYANGATVLITGADQPEYNGYYSITSVPNANTFTYTLIGTPVSPATGAISTQISNYARVSLSKTISTLGSKVTLPGPKAVASITRSSATATVTCYSHGFSNGAVVMISSANEAEYNGAFTIANVTTNTFTYTVATTAPASATGTIGAISTRSVTSISRSGTTATVTASGHGFTTGNMVRISGATPAEYNGVFSVVVLDTNRFTYTVSDALAASASGSLRAAYAGIFPSGTTATVTLTNHGFVTGQTVLISGATQSEYNGYFPVTVLTPHAFTYTMSGAPLAPATGAVSVQTAALNPNRPSLAGITRNGATATATLTGHGYWSGQTVLISGATQPEYNGAFTITNVTANTFDFTVSGEPLSPAGGTTYAQACGVSYNGTTAIVSLNGHGYATGTLIRISGADQPEYNGTFAITNVTGNTFTYTLPSVPAGPATGNIFAWLGNLTRSGSTATVTLPNHGYVEGQPVYLTGAWQPEYNGSFKIFNVTPYSFDFAVSGQPVSPASGPISITQPLGIIRNGSTAIVSFVGHGFVAGDRVRIAGADQAEYNGTFTVLTAGVNAFTYEVAGAPASPATGTALTALNMTFNPNTFRLVGDTLNSGLAMASGISIGDMYYCLQGLNPDGTPNPNYPVLLDIDNYIDYLLITYYLGTTDWPGHNFFAARPPDPGSTGYKSFSWDNDSSFGLTTDMTKAYQLIAQPYYFLSGSPEFRIRFADHVQKHFFNGGALTPEVAAALYREMGQEIELAVIGESARWGDQATSPAPWPHTVAEWRNQFNWALTIFFPQRTAIVLQQFRNNTLLPSFDAPAFALDGVSQYGGAFTTGAELTMRATAGATIYYCLDGSDPRLPGGGINPAALVYEDGWELDGPTLIKARAWLNGEWSALADVTFYLDLAPAIRVTELMYNPADPTAAEIAAGFIDNSMFEFLEIKNTGSVSVSLDGIRFTGGVDFTFPDVSIAAGQCLVVAANPDAFLFRYPGRGSALIPGSYTGQLSSTGETLSLETALGGVIQQFTYSDGWYSHTDGAGFSLTVRDPAQALSAWDSSDGWRSSAAPGGTPGYEDTLVTPGSIVINEVFPHSDEPQGDMIELHNTTDAAIDVGGWFLSDEEGALTKYRIAAGTIIPAHGYLVLTQTANFGDTAPDPGRLSGFALSEYGDDLYLSSNVSGVAGGYREHVDFEATPNGVAQGLFYKGTGGTDFTLLSVPTFGAGPNFPGAANDVLPYAAPLVINAVMYHPADPTAEEVAAGFTDAEAFEYLELYNHTDAPLTLAEYFVGDGAGFSFGWCPTGTSGEVWTLESGATATWSTTALQNDSYTIYAHFRLTGGDGQRRSLDDLAQYTIQTAAGPVVVTVDQNQPGVSSDEIWVCLGTYAFTGTGSVQLARGLTGADNWTIAEKVKFVKSGHEVVLSAPTVDSFFTRTGRTTIGPGGFVVLVANYAAFDARYHVAANNLPVVGQYTGNLNNNGEMLRLYQFGVADPNIVPAYEIDHVSYGDSGYWPGRPDGEGPALIRVHPAVYGNTANNWQAGALNELPGRVHTHHDKTPPTSPTSLTAQSTAASGNQITLNWTASVDTQSFVDHYLVYRDGEFPVVVYTTSYTDTGVQAMTPYSYQVSAVNRDGYESKPSTAVSVSVPGVVSSRTPEGKVEIVFSEPMQPATAGVAANYAINGVAPTSATLAPGGTKVILTTGQFDSATLLASTSGARVLVPADGSLGTAWTEPNFTDSAWTLATTGVGFTPSLPMETEPNDALATADWAGRNFSSFAYPMYHLGLRGTADTNDDWFRLGLLQSGDLLSIAGAGQASARGTSSNLVIELYRSNSTLVASDDDGGPGLDGLIARYMIPTDDTYYLKIKRKDASVATGTYQVGIWLEDGVTPPNTGGTFTDEVEANDSLAGANNPSSSWRQMQYLSRTTGEISAVGDVDYYKFTFTAGDLVSINVDSQSGLGVKVSLLNASGAVVATEDGSSLFTGDFALDAPIFAYLVSTSGTYYLKVESEGSSTGSYNADVYLSSTTTPAIFGPLINTSLQAAMQGVSASAYLRIPFTVTSPSAFTQLRLRMKYDDGFVAYLNGTEIARRNAPTAVAWNSTATAARGDALTTVFEEIDVTAFLSLLVTGSNVLAIQALNLSAADDDLLIVPELVGGKLGSHYTLSMSNLTTQSGNALGSPLQATFDYLPQGTGNVIREAWTGIGGVNVVDLTNHANYPVTPTLPNLYPSSLEEPNNWSSSSYGSRMRAYLYPPMTGDYTFWIASDDASELWLSLDDNPANKQLIAFVSAGGSFPNYRQWTTYASQKSASVRLVAGVKYYLEVLHKQSGGNDHCSVRWQLPDGSWENGDINAPIPGIRLSPIGTLPDMTAPSVPQNLRATLLSATQVQLNWSPSTDAETAVARYQVYRDGAKYSTPVTTTSFIDTSASSAIRHRYQVTAINADGYESGLSVALNVVPLGIVSATAWSPTAVQVTFTELLDRTTAETAANYTVSGTTVTGARLEANGMTVTLTTTAMSLNSSHPVTASGIRTQAGVTFSGSASCTYGGSILREVFQNVGGGSALADLRFMPAYPNSPTSMTYPTLFEAPYNGLSNSYSAERLRGYLCPDVSGTYYFYLASDDNGELWLSTDDNPANKTLIASVPGLTASREWGKYPAQKSGPISLVAGQRYYVEAIAKQNSGSNGLAVTWQRPDSPTVASIIPNVAATSITRSGSTATVALTNHGLVAGQSVVIRGATQSEYNGTYPVTIVDGSRFSYSVTGTPTSPAGGSITVVASALGVRTTGATITRTDTTATMTLANHGFVEGQTVLIGGAGQSQYNGSFTIFNVTATSFDFTVSAAAVSPATGSIFAQPYAISRNGATAIVSLANHGFTTGSTVTIAGADQAEYNGNVAITVLTPNTFSYTVSTTAVSPASGSISANGTVITRNASLVTVTLASHGYANNDAVFVAGADQGFYNGLFTATNVSSTTFTYAVTGTPTTAATGTVKASRLIPIPGTYLAAAAPYNAGYAYTVTVDGKGTSDSRPKLDGTILDPYAAVNVCINGVYYAAVNNGNSTWALADDSIPAALADGTYHVTVCAADTYGRVGFDTTASELTIDTVAPTVTFTGFNPHGTAPITGLQIVFNGPVEDFDLNDLRLTFNNGPDLITGGESLTTSDNIHWNLTGLATRAGDGVYRLTILAAGSGIEDAGDNELATDAVATWTVDNVPPTVTLPAVLPVLQHLAVPAVNIVFDEWVDGLDVSDLRLTCDGGANLLTGSQTLTTADHITWTLGGLSDLTGTSGHYVVTLVAAGSGIQDATGHALAAGASVAWDTDSVAPTVTFDAVLPNPRNAPLSALSFTFSELVTAFSAASLRLSVNGGANLLNGTETLQTSDSLHWTLGNLAGLTAANGNYQLTIATGVTDPAGNPLVVAPRTWTMDSVAPTATIASVSPDPRTTPVSQLTLTLSELVQGFDRTHLTLTRNGGANLLTGTESFTTTDNLHWTLSGLSGLTATQGMYVLTITAAGITDAAGNAMPADVSTSWSLVPYNLDADGNGTVDALTDGILILRYLFAPGGAWNFIDAVGPGATRTTRELIRTHLDGARTGALDADGNGTADALTDGILILRYLFNRSGSWSYSDAIGPGAIRNTRDTIRAYLDQFNPAVVPMSPAFSAGLTGEGLTSSAMALPLETQPVATVTSNDSPPAAASASSPTADTARSHDSVLRDWQSTTENEMLPDPVEEVALCGPSRGEECETRLFEGPLDDLLPDLGRLS